MIKTLRRVSLGAVALMAAALIGAGPVWASHCTNADKNAAAGVQAVIDLNTGAIVWISNGLQERIDQGLVDRRIFPSINIELSGTRKEELLYHPDEYNKVVILRRALTGVPPVEAMELLLNKLKKTQSNVMFLLGMGAG